MPPDTIGELIKERRQILQITQADLADLAGVALRTIKIVETGRGNPSLSTMLKLTETLGLEIVIKVRDMN